MATSKSPRRTRKVTSEERGVIEGYRSGFEERVSAQLKAAGVSFTYEKTRLKFVQPAKNRTYTPDFVLSNGIIVETKGRFVLGDRQKHLWVRECHPDLDIRFVFQKSSTTISKTSKTTYADWCIKNGFQFADKLIPPEWLEETK